MQDSKRGWGLRHRGTAASRRNGRGRYYRASRVGRRRFRSNVAEILRPNGRARSISPTFRSTGARDLECDWPGAAELLSVCTRRTPAALRVARQQLPLQRINWLILAAHKSFSKAKLSGISHRFLKAATFALSPYLRARRDCWTGLGCNQPSPDRGHHRGFESASARRIVRVWRSRSLAAR